MGFYLRLDDGGLLPIARNTEGEANVSLTKQNSTIKLTRPDGTYDTVEDSNTTYTFTQSGSTLVITGTDGTSKTITLGGEITAEAIANALGYVPADDDEVITLAENDIYEAFSE